MQLLDVCSVRSGYTLRSRPDADARGVLTVTAADLDAPVLNSLSLSRIVAPPFSDRHIVQAGDVLFRSRGQQTGAVLVGSELGEIAIAIMPVFILRVATDMLRADYLAWLLNSRESQDYFNREAQGQSIRMISKQVLENLPVRLPETDAQADVAALATLGERERQLALRHAELRHDLQAEQLLQSVNDLTNPDSQRRTE